MIHGLEEAHTMPELLVAADAACVRWALFKTLVREGEDVSADVTAAATAMAAKQATHCSAGTAPCPVCALLRAQ